MNTLLQTVLDQALFFAEYILRDTRGTVSASTCLTCNQPTPAASCRLHENPRAPASRNRVGVK